MSEPVMCDATFQESTAKVVRGQRITGTCRLCQQKVGAVGVREGVARINFHETTAQAAEAEA